MAKAKYSGRAECVWIKPIELLDRDKNDLSKICDHPDFINNFQSIAEQYRAYKEIYSGMPTDAQEVATLKDLAQYSASLRYRLDNMPGIVSARLYKISGEIRAMKKTLQRLEIEATLAAARVPQSTGGRPRKKEKRAATQQLKLLFEKFNLPWTYNTWPDRETCPTIDCLELIFLEGGDKSGRHSALEYIKESIEQQKPGKPTKK
jgi:hypothetical protein